MYLWDRLRKGAAILLLAASPLLSSAVSGGTFSFDQSVRINLDKLSEIQKSLLDRAQPFVVFARHKPSPQPWGSLHLQAYLETLRETSAYLETFWEQETFSRRRWEAFVAQSAKLVNTHKDLERRFTEFILEPALEAFEFALDPIMQENMEDPSSALNAISAQVYSLIDDFSDLAIGNFTHRSTAEPETILYHDAVTQWVLLFEPYSKASTGFVNSVNYCRQRK